ncbi:MAG: putative metalloprotease [uncultured Rubrobacteraceae bacterium]|uniref:Neutral metalloproteinase n=1 Tax=uncultured Rubrobacteraceae bacterium TaxID=349277 RepID=A0A6J4SB89_9ACTN|nr:MAG: putative metalloprotease [uncultured Rubrobacteraceae bacterium]
MCEQVGHRHSIFCVVPPHVLREIVRNGGPDARESALKTLSIDNTQRNLRGIRLAAPVDQALAAGVSALGTVQGGKQRTIHGANNTETLPGDVVRSEGAPATGDRAVDEAYDGLGHTYDYYLNILGRNSLDGQGGPLHAVVHFGQNFDNAFWDGRYMVFGDGFLLDHLTDLTVATHELTHGVTEVEAQLLYHKQSGALNEHVSDVFGSVVKQYVNGRQDAGQADWLIGEGIWRDDIQGKALRSMSNPGSAHDDPLIGKDPQPAHMDGYVRTHEDNGGVHINSGIPNRAFYLAATGIGGFAGDKAARIWYATLRDDRLRIRAKFKEFALLTYINAWNLFPEGDEANIVKSAWAEVGIEISQ